VVSKIFYPVIASLNWVANGILRLFRVEPKDEATSAYTLDEVAGIVELSTREGLLDDASGTLSAAFEFTSKRVRDVEVPTGTMHTLPDGVTVEQVREAVAESGWSRYVVTDASGTPTGYLHLKDVLDLADRGDQPVPAKRVRRLITVPRDADLEDALATMRRQGVHVARTAAADGTIHGAVFLEDIIEELVGEIADASHEVRTA
jgi:CBS domain containing-hemolysin-like protein